VPSFSFRQVVASIVVTYGSQNYCPTSDVWGLAPMFSSDGFCYFVIFVDVHTKHIWYYPLVAKSDVFSTFQRFQTLVEHQFSLKIKSVQTDWGSEYRKLNKFFQAIGIHHWLICPHTCCYPIFDPGFDKFPEKIQK